MPFDLLRIDDRLSHGLRHWRRTGGVKQESLAHDIGVSQATISRLESGQALPGERDLHQLLARISASPSAPSDRQLIRFVRQSAEPLHLVCDLTHRLLAASPSRASEWAIAPERLNGRSLWRYASPDIVEAECGLGAIGWHERTSLETRFVTASFECSAISIRKSVVHWVRIPLANGTFARLVRTGNAGTE
ncbi:helix-turn-helix transcriptional regulator [Erythrobacter sp.]|uniref:helix-turn-helix domain-containing protein n=1 Tax=Erythrobacter sp. TaxID=1042 RepID=UPI001B2607A8|nr:helix-turn-helix transcriptional regulator [Erythrobacter sp.]MBO6527569.1 helix-turn-helix transcriptional regulator [Erythrobacter sp.]MBO6530249.1 helix-turn-helix transcriptional regulator [Erythrobacter sp.]